MTIWGYLAIAGIVIALVVAAVAGWVWITTKNMD